MSNITIINHQKCLSLVRHTKNVIKEILQLGDAVIDATVGNGHDTCFLAECVGPTGRVFGFDVQSAALATAQGHLDVAGSAAQVALILASHADMALHVPSDFHGGVGAVMFNLGYLPGSDQQITTRPETTQKAVRVALELLREGGCLTLLVYTGHSGGQEEAQIVRECMEQLANRGHAVTMERPSDRMDSPVLWVVIKRGKANNI